MMRNRIHNSLSVADKLILQLRGVDYNSCPINVAKGYTLCLSGIFNELAKQGPHIVIRKKVQGGYWQYQKDCLLLPLTQFDCRPSKSDSRTADNLVSRLTVMAQLREIVNRNRARSWRQTQLRQVRQN